MSKEDWCLIKTVVPWLSEDHWRDVRIWLIENVDDRDYIIKTANHSYPIARSVWFGYEKDATWFTLRWGGE